MEFRKQNKQNGIVWIENRTMTQSDKKSAKCYLEQKKSQEFVECYTFGTYIAHGEDE